MLRKWMAIMLGITTTIVLFCVCSIAYADIEGQWDNIFWSINNEGLLLIKGNGSMPDDDEDPTEEWHQYSEQIKKVEVSDGITRIGDYAFAYLWHVENIKIPESVTDIGMGAFCSTLISEIHLPVNLKSIGPYALDNNDEIRRIVLPNQLTMISKGLFCSCNNLNEILLPEGITEIGEEAFEGCISLKHIDLPSNVTKIGKNAFFRCDSLEMITIPTKVNHIGKGAFSECNSLLEISIPAGVDYIGSGAFSSCSRLQQIMIPDSNKTYRTVDGVLFTNNMATLMQFPAGKDVQSYSIPEGVSILVEYAFEGCEKLKEIISSSNLNTIDRGCFRNCTNLYSIYLPIGLSFINSNAFGNCDSLKDVYYEGSEEYRRMIMIDEYNTSLENATWHYSKNKENNDTISAFVARCYKLILNRDADEGGLAGWSEALTSKTATAAQIINGFVSSDEYNNRNLSAGESVDILYNTMLDRAADAEGKAGWVDALNKGYTLQNIIDGFCGSPEFKAICDSFGIEPGSVGAAAPADMSTPRGKIEAFVKRCYSLILSRDADQGGLQGWSDALESGAGQACQIIDGFVRSEEYVNRKLDHGASVDILYKTMLNREPDPDGRAGWVDALAQGYTLQHIINGFCGSAEFTAICNDYGITAGTLSVASALVKREAITPEGDEAEAPVVYQGYNSEFINEEKIRAFVEHCYVAVFGREGDAEGIENYTKLILNGRKMPKKVAYEFIFSPEFQEKLPGNEEFIRILYRLYFDREPGAEELSGWVKMLENGASLEKIVDGFAGSAEYKAIVNAMKE